MTIYVVLLASGVLCVWLVFCWLVSESSRPPISYVQEDGNIALAVVVGVAVAAAAWLVVRTATGRRPSRTVTVVVVAASVLIVQAASAVAWELGRRQGEADERARFEACAQADVAVLRDVYDTLGSAWGVFSGTGLADGSCRGPEVEGLDRDVVVARMASDGWALVESEPHRVLERGARQVHMRIEYYPGDPEEGDGDVALVDFWVEP